MTSKDWVIEAAKEIANESASNKEWEEARRLSLDVTEVPSSKTRALFYWVQGRIMEHCPFKPDTAYMEVPRCDRCVRWKKDDTDAQRGECHLMYEQPSKMWPDLYEGINTSADFGCTQFEAGASVRS